MLVTKHIGFLYSEKGGKYMAKKTNYSVNGIDYYRVRTTKGQPIGENVIPTPKDKLVGIILKRMRLI